MFIILIIISSSLIIKNNSYQRYAFLTSANGISASIYKLTNGVTSYFNLRDINEDLQQRQAQLELEVVNLRKTVETMKEESGVDSLQLKATNRYKFILAHVINNSIHKPDNYITIEKGSADGVEPQMGVIDQNGIVGIVDVVNTHVSRVISLLNKDFKLFCKVNRSSHFGTLIWDGKSPQKAILTEMPSHVRFIKGDTISTSGYSAVFPPDIPVGTIESGYRDKDGNFSSLVINLFTDFSTLSTVRVIDSPLRKEIQELEQPEEDK